MCKVGFLPLGSNQEDGATVSKAACERGMLQSTRLRMDRDQQNSQGMFVNPEKFERPNPASTVAMQHSSVEHLMLNGLPRLGTVLQPGDVVIGKTTALRARARRRPTRRNAAPVPYLPGLGSRRLFAP